MDVTEEVKGLVNDFLKETLDVVSFNAQRYASDITKTASLYYFYKSKNDTTQAEITLMHLKSQCFSLSTITAIQEAKKIEKLLWLSLNVVLKVAVKALLK